MNRAILLIILTSLFSGCATTAAYKKVLNTWIGSSAEHLIYTAGWGIPTSEFTLPNGDKAYCYYRHRSFRTPMYTTPSTSYSTVVGNTVYTNTYGGNIAGGQTFTRDCRTCFFINKKNIIYNYNFSGNNCVAYTS